MSKPNAASPVAGEETFLDRLALQAASGKDESFARLVDHFTPAICSMISPLAVPPAEMEDLMQEGLIGLYKAVRLFDPALSSFGTFARICIRSALSDGARKYHKLNLDLADGDDEIPASPSQTPEHILMGKEELRELMNKVDTSLSPMERRIFGLHLQGRRIGEIAEVMGKDKKSVENTLYRLRRKLSSPV